MSPPSRSPPGTSPTVGSAAPGSAAASPLLPGEAADEAVIACRAGRRGSPGRPAADSCPDDLAQHRLQRLGTSGDRPSSVADRFEHGRHRDGSSSAQIVAGSVSEARLLRVPSAPSSAGRCGPGSPARPGATARVSFSDAFCLTRTSVIVLEPGDVGVELARVRLDEAGDLVERDAEVVQRGAEVGALARRGRRRPGPAAR